MRFPKAFRSGAVLLLAVLVAMLPAAALPTPQAGTWQWPVAGVREVIAPFRAPAHDYGPGHRGIDLTAPIGAIVYAPADGVVAFRGTVVDRALMTIDHGNGLVTTFEPMRSELQPGTVVAAGDEIGVVSNGGHSPVNQMHLGVRWNGVYINPMLMFGDVPRAVLLPCCAPVAATRGGGPVGRSL